MEFQNRRTTSYAQPLTGSRPLSGYSTNSLIGQRLFQASSLETVLPPLSLFLHRQNLTNPMNLFRKLSALLILLVVIASCKRTNITSEKPDELSPTAVFQRKLS